MSLNWNGIGLSMLWQGVGKRDWYPWTESGFFWGKWNRAYNSLMKTQTGDRVVKIDKSFTDKIHQNGQSAFVYQMGQFIQSAKEEVIFEGIEEEQQRTFLMECGFNYGQGYYFDRPLPLEEFEKKYI